MQPLSFNQPPAAQHFSHRGARQLPLRRSAPSASWRACVSKPVQASVVDELQRESIGLPSRGLSLAALKLPAAGPRARAPSSPPVLLVHGSLHGAWAWAPLLARWNAAGGLGADAVAVTLRGRTSDPPVPPGTVLDVADHVDDIVALVDVVQARSGRVPLLVGHSSGGYYCQRAVQKLGVGRVAGLVLLASIPPSGNGALVWRTVFRLGIPTAWKITMGFVRNTVATDIKTCRELFFTNSRTWAATASADYPAHSDNGETIVSDEVLRSFMKEFRQASKVRVDMRKVVPMTRHNVSPPADLGGRVLVIGGADDVIVDVKALEEAAQFWAANERYIVLPDCPHDLMLASSRDRVADIILEWIGRTQF